MSLMIRAATVADATTIAELNAVVQSLHADAHPQHFQKADKEKLAQHARHCLSQDGNFAFLAFTLNNAVGYVQGELCQRNSNAFHKAHGGVYVHQIGVAQEMRGQGIGTALLDRTCQLGREHGVDRLALDVWRFNEPARRFFERYGLRTYNERRWMQIGVEPPVKAAD